MSKSLDIFYRYIALCAPFVRLKYNFKAMAYMMPILIFVPLYNIPRFFEVSWETSEEGKLEVTMTKLRQNVYYKSIYITWMYMVFIYVLPFAGLSILNMLIFLDVR